MSLKHKRIIIFGIFISFLLIPLFDLSATVPNTKPFNDEIVSREICDSMDSKDCYPTLYISDTGNFQAYKYDVRTWVTQAFGSSAYLRGDACITKYGWGSSSANCQTYVSGKVKGGENYWLPDSQIDLGDLSDYNAVSLHIYVNNAYTATDIKAYGRRVYIDYLTPSTSSAEVGTNISLSWDTTNASPGIPPNVSGPTIFWDGTSDGGGSTGVQSSDNNWGSFTRNTPGTANFTLKACGPEGNGPDCVEVTQTVNFTAINNTKTPTGQVTVNPNSCTQRCSPVITWSTSKATKTYITITGTSPDGGRNITPVDSATSGSVTDTGSEGIGLKEGSYTYNLYAKNNSVGYTLVDTAALAVGPAGGSTPTPPPSDPPPPSPNSVNCVEDATIVSPANGTTIPLGMGETYFFQPQVKNGNNTDQTKWYGGTLSIYRFHKRSGVPTISPASRSVGNTIYKNTTWNMSRGFTITAPSTPGTYPLEMQMVHVGTPPTGSDYIRSRDNKTCTYPPPETTERGFGETLILNIYVTPVPTPVPPTVDLDVKKAGDSSYSENSVDLTWTEASANPAIDLNWITTATVTSCTASGDWSGNKSASGGTESLGNLTSKSTYTYVITCDGGTTSSVTVNVGPPPPPTVDIKANSSDGPINISWNTSANLSWSSTNAGSCTASGDWSGSKALSGSQSTGNLTNPKTYNYTLGCSGNGSASDTVQVILNSPTPNDPTNVTVIQPDYCMSGPAATVGWTYSDPSGSPQSAYQVQVTDTGSFNNPILDTGKINSGSNAYFTGQGILQFNITYKARVRVWNSYDVVSNWSNPSSSWKTPSYPYPQVDFNWTANGIFNNPSPPLGKLVQFTDATVFNGNPNGRKWNWAFGDAGSSTTQNPSHTYSTEGSYYVTLTATDNANQSCTKTKGPLIIQKPIPKWREVAPK